MYSFLHHIQLASCSTQNPTQKDASYLLVVPVGDIFLLPPDIL